MRFAIKACRLSGPTTSEFEQADRIRGPQPPQRTRGVGYSFCREIIRQMTKFPSSVENERPRCDSRIAAVPRVPASMADDLAVALVGRSPADVARVDGGRRRGLERLRGARCGPHVRRAIAISEEKTRARFVCVAAR